MSVSAQRPAAWRVASARLGEWLVAWKPWTAWERLPSECKVSATPSEPETSTSKTAWPSSAVPWAPDNSMQHERPHALNKSQVRQLCQRIPRYIQHRKYKRRRTITRLDSLGRRSKDNSSINLRKMSMQ